MLVGTVGIVKVPRGYPHHATEYRVRWRERDGSGRVRATSEHLVSVPHEKTTRQEKARFARYLRAMLESKMRELGVPVAKPVLREALPIQEAVERFGIWARAQYSPSNAKAYILAVRGFVDHCQVDPTIPVQTTGDLQQMHVARWRKARLAYGWAMATLVHNARGVQAFCNWLLVGEYSKNIMTVLPDSIRNSRAVKAKRRQRYQRDKAKTA